MEPSWAFGSATIACSPSGETTTSLAGAQMFAVQMIVNVPTRIHLSSLREEFLELCDNLNLDAILEPVKM